MRNGQLIINGEIQVEPYTAEPADYTLPPLRVPPGQVFVLGDNRNKSFVCHTGLEPQTSRPQTGLLLTRASLALDRTLTTGASCRSRTSSATPSSPTGRPIGSAPCPMACLDGIRWDPHIHPPAPTTPPSARCPLLCKYTVCPSRVPPKSTRCLCVPVRCPLSMRIIIYDKSSTPQ